MATQDRPKVLTIAIDKAAATATDMFGYDLGCLRKYTYLLWSI
jgi:hypothetical protein